jgi:2-phospho-L-lactate transferase/gluconeogenesis factor (CofD/UPF0052 family)
MTGANPIRIALFCGGRGSATIIRALLRHTEIELTLIVNAYDDGLSTGALRNFIPGMLGPSDFRKNFSYLLGNYSSAQYALKSLMEYRLPAKDAATDMESLAHFCRRGEFAILAEPLKAWFMELPSAMLIRLRGLLGLFFDHAAASQTAFDYRDCSLGNLVFAGAYLLRDRNFNAAAAEVGDLVGSRARLLNVSDEQHRVLMGLKQDGTILASEGEIVGPQSAAAIADLYLLEQGPAPEETAALATMDTEGKRAWLTARNATPDLSVFAAAALAQADIVLYGPGTQHSSLLPSYRIAAVALTAAPAPIKALVMNLDNDNDMQGLTASDIFDRALGYGATVSHILIDHHSRVPLGVIAGDLRREARIVQGNFSNRFHPAVHNGGAIVDRVLALYAGTGSAAPSLEIFADIHNRSVASQELVEEFLETDWKGGDVRLILNRGAAGDAALPVTVTHHTGLFPETAYFRDWLETGRSDYLALMTGDGAYSFRDVQNIVSLLERQPSLGGVFGSRTQSRRQFITSIQAAYGENHLLYALGKIAAFFLSALFYLRTGVIFSDPLTGLRVFRRASMIQILVARRDREAPLALVRRLIRHNVEVAELPVLYRTFSGFTDPRWRVRRGLRNLASLLSWR